MYKIPVKFLVLIAQQVVDVVDREHFSADEIDRAEVVLPDTFSEGKPFDFSIGIRAV